MIYLTSTVELTAPFRLSLSASRPSSLGSRTRKLSFAILVGSAYRLPSRMSSPYSVLAWAAEKGMVNFVRIMHLVIILTLHRTLSFQSPRAPRSRPSSSRCEQMSVVSGGSSCSYAFSHYKGAAADATPLVFVGKGITFDSGGISIKPSSVSLPEFPALLNPAQRRNRACPLCVEIWAVLLRCARPRWRSPNSKFCTHVFLSSVCPPPHARSTSINLVVLTPLTENMPGPAANKPGDM